jgi:hypothetical protein
MLSLPLHLLPYLIDTLKLEQCYNLKNNFFYIKKKFFFAESVNFNPQKKLINRKIKINQKYMVLIKKLDQIEPFFFD